MLDFTKNFIPFLEKIQLANIPYNVEVCNDGLKIVFSDGSDVALNSYIQGYKEGLLEGYNGKFVTDTWDSVTGYLTADKAFELLTK
jgi:hypothetical protein